VKEERPKKNIPGKIPFLFIVPEGQSCKAQESGTRDPEVEVYIVGLSGLPAEEEEHSYSECLPGEENINVVAGTDAKTFWKEYDERHATNQLSRNCRRWSGIEEAEE
jgi:hypothetical protein